MQTLIEIQHLNAGYDGRTVLRDVDLTVYDRDFLGIICATSTSPSTTVTSWASSVPTEAERRHSSVASSAC